MKSYNFPRVLDEANRFLAPPRKQWVKPSIEIIALESAESGVGNSRDGHGGHFIPHRS